jgi:hypothetical protein
MAADMWEGVYYLHRFVLTLFVGGAVVFGILGTVSLFLEEGNGAPSGKRRISIKWRFIVYFLVIMASMTQAYLSTPLKQLKFEVTKMKLVATVESRGVVKTIDGHEYEAVRGYPDAWLVYNWLGKASPAVGSCMEVHFVLPRFPATYNDVQMGRLIPTSCDRLGEVIPVEGTFEQRIALWERNLEDLDHLSGKALYDAMRKRYGLKLGDPYP